MIKSKNFNDDEVFDVFMSVMDELDAELAESIDDEVEDLENQWLLQQIEQQVMEDITKIKHLSVGDIEIYQTVSDEEYWTIWNFYSIKKGIRLPGSETIDVLNPVFIIDVPSYKVCVYEYKDIEKVIDILMKIITFINS